MEFEWDVGKAQSNIEKHGVTFEHATYAFFDKTAITEEDARRSYGEDRSVIYGYISDRLYAVVFANTRIANKIRIISARRANKRERKRYGTG